MQQWWLWWRGFAAAPICSKVVVALRCCSGGSLPSFVVALLSTSGALFTVAWWWWSTSGCAFAFRAGCGFVFLLAAGFRAVVRCGEEDEIVVRCVASDKGGGCHGDGKRWWKLGLLEHGADVWKKMVMAVAFRRRGWLASIRIWPKAEMELYGFG